MPEKHPKPHEHLPRPPHEPPHPPRPLHEHKKGGIVISSVIIGTAVTLVFAIILYFFNVPITIIIPAAAPIWIGAISLSYTVLSRP